MKETDAFAGAVLQHVASRHYDRNTIYPQSALAWLGSAEVWQAADEIAKWPDYAPTPLRSLRPLAQAIGVGVVLYKDESTRFGLGSFKALGGAYAVLQRIKRQVQERTGEKQIRTDDLIAGRYQSLTRDVTVTAATDGNHGRAVAWAARLFGCCCVRTAGTYDDSVRRALQDAKTFGWWIVPDTSAGGNEEPARHVLAGYTLIAHEIRTQLSAGVRQLQLQR